MTTNPKLQIIASDKKALPDEKALITDAQAGDANAFRQLYDFYRDRIFSLIAYTLKDRQQAEDVLQTVFIKVYRALPFFRQDSSFITWVYRVAINECKNRQRRRNIFVSLNELTHPIVEPVTDDPFERETTELNQTVRQAVMSLTPKLRTVVVLKYLEELSYEEISSILDCSTGTVASRLNRALAALQKNLGRGAKY